MRGVRACAEFRAAGEIAVAEFRSLSQGECALRRRWPSHPSRNSPWLARDPEKAHPGLDPGWEPVFGKDQAQNKNLERDD